MAKYIVSIDEIYGYNIEINDAINEEDAEQQAKELLEELDIESSETRETKVISVNLK